MPSEAPTEGPQSVPTNPGILCVGSKSINTSVLDPLDFAEWYENTQIQEIHQTGGFSDTQRYESLAFSKKHRGLDQPNVPENINFPYDFLTTYNMPDLHFRETEEFASLAKKARPDDQNLVENLFKQAEFISRFCQQMSVDWPNEGGSKAPYIVTLTSSSVQVATDLATKITKFSGCERTRRYKIHEGSVLSALKRTYIPEKSELFIFEFGKLDAVTGAVKALDGSDDVQVGFWALRRSYDGAERTPAAWKPKK